MTQIYGPVENVFKNEKLCGPPNLHEKLKSLPEIDEYLLPGLIEPGAPQEI
jgi:hypothetical protein